MDILIDIEYIRTKGLYVEEYLFLRNQFFTGLDKIISIEQVVRPINLERLEALLFIKQTTGGIILRQKTIEMFSTDDLYDKFISTFPIKTPSGRPLSPLRAGGKNYELIKKKFNKIFKNRADAEKAIKVLESELLWRKQQNNLEYQHNVETWLNQADYEKFEYLLEEDLTAEEKGENYDWMN